MGIIQPPGLTLEQIASCQRFGKKVWGEPLFSGPLCDGRHSWNCPECSEVMLAKENERKPAPPQPWERFAA